MKTLEQLKAAGEAPEWLENSAFQTLRGGYLFGEETPKDMYRRVASTVSRSLKKPELEARFFDILWKNWLCPSTPVLCNAGTDRGLPISCFSSYMADDTYEILETLQEVAMLSKYGGGTAIHINESSRANKRFLCEHGDFDEFLHSRRPTGDTNRQCLNLHHGVCVSNAFIDKVKAGDTEARRRWRELIKSRVETGEPYVFFSDNANDQAPEVLKNTGIRLKGSNLCSEIFLPTDKDHTFVCCLSSLNLARWDEWKDTDTVQLSVWFLDGIMEEFIQKSANLRGFEKALRFAKKSRALGLGVLGLHSYFQKNMIAFDSLQAYLQNKIIFKKIREEAEIATGYLAKEYGEPEWCKGHGRRNATLMAVAPTVSNSLIASNVSQGIEPWIANAFAQKSAKGTFVRRNPELEKLLKSIGQDTDEVWGSILKNDGSVQHLECLTAEQKEVYLTARELNQFAIVKLAAERQKFIDQGQSINVFFPANSDPKYINQVHLEAANSGLKSLYYLRSTSVLKAEQNSNAVYKRELTECTWCEG